MVEMTAPEISPSLDPPLAFLNPSVCLADRWAIGGKYKGESCRRKQNILNEIWKG
jgi:hypothetical protein